MLHAPRKLYFAANASIGVIKVGVSNDPINRQRNFPHMLKKHGLPPVRLEYFGWVEGSFPEENAFRKRFREYQMECGNDFFRDVPEIRAYVATLTLEKHIGFWYNIDCQCSICVVKMLCECGRCSTCWRRTHKRPPLRADDTVPLTL
jgi:hypothetical protein